GSHGYQQKYRRAQEFHSSLPLAGASATSLLLFALQKRIASVRVTHCFMIANAGAHLLPEAGAQWTLEAVRYSTSVSPRPPGHKKRISLTQQPFAVPLALRRLSSSLLPQLA